MVKIQFDLTKNENAKIKRLKYLFKVNGKADVIKRLIKKYSESNTNEQK